MSNQAQIKHKLNATVHYCSRSKPLLTASTHNTRTNLRFTSAQVTQTRCGLEPNKDKSHKSRTARTQKNYLKALTKSKNMAVRFSKQTKHFSTSLQASNVAQLGKTLSCTERCRKHSRNQTQTFSELSWIAKRREKLRLHCKCRTTVSPSLKPLKPSFSLPFEDKV